MLKVRREHLLHLSLLQDDWSTLGSDVSLGNHLAFSSYLQPDLSDDIADFTITDVQPHILQAKASTADPDNPTFRQAMNSPEADEW